MERKDFLKTTCGLCIGIGAGLLITELAACSHLPIYKTEVQNNKVTVPLSLFATTDLQIISPKGLDYDLAIRKQANDTYTALLMRCTHADNPLQSSGNGYSCSLHGSAYSKDGAVVQGPAETAMVHYPATVSGTDLIITITQR